MKKLLLLLVVALFCTILSAGYNFDGRVIWSKQGATKDSLGYFIIELDGVVWDTFGVVDTFGLLRWQGNYVWIGDGGTVNHADGDGDLYVEDELEVDGVSYLGMLNCENILVACGDTIIVRDATCADSSMWFDDGDTTRLESDNPIKIGNSLIVSVVGDVTATKSITLSDSLVATTSLWWYCKYMDAINLSPGGSGAVQTIPDDNTSGGYQLDVDTEYLYFNGGICNNWDEASDMEVKIRWELNAGGGGANDSVFFDIDCWYKGVTEDTTKYQTWTEGELVNNDGQYMMYTVTFTIDYDLALNVVQQGDIFSFRLNLNTTRSDVDNVIVNFGRFRYRTKVPQPTTY